MSVYNIFDMGSGEELGRYFATTAKEALDAMARISGFGDFEQACGASPKMREQLLVTEL